MCMSYKGKSSECGSKNTERSGSLVTACDLLQGDGKYLRLIEEENGVKLVLQHADISDAGEYLCVAENENEMGKLEEAP